MPTILYKFTLTDAIIKCKLLELNMTNQIKLLRIREAAEMLGVNPETLRRWDKEGRLKAVRVGSRRNIGDRRYLLKDLEKFIEEIKK